jgi:hypothetical protein
MDPDTKAKTAKRLGKRVSSHWIVRV